MGLTYTIPGAYFEVQDPPVSAAGAVRTDVAGFIGLADRGPFNEPVKVESWDQFRARFGDPIREGLLPDAVRAFFDNGGRTCFVVRAGPTCGLWYAVAQLPLPKREKVVLNVLALDPGRAGERIVVQVVPRPAGRLTLVVRVEEDGRLGAVERERWSDLVTEDDERATDDTRFVTRVLERGSKLIRATVAPRDEPPEPPKKGKPAAGDTSEDEPKYPPWLWSEEDERAEKREARAVARTPGRLRRPGVRAGGGSDTAFDQLTLAHLTGEGSPAGAVWGLAALERRPEVALVAIPDLVWFAPVDERKPAPARCGLWPAVPPATAPRPARRPFTPEEALDGQRAIIRHCERMRDRFAVLDPRADDDPTAACARARELPTAFAALYFPWLYSARRTDALTNEQRVPPSAAVVGMIARVDRRDGPHKAPANERLLEVQAPVRALDEPTLAQLHAASVNPIVAVPGRGIRVTGARTLTRPDALEWRYVSTRRLVLMIEAFVTRIGHEVAFEGNSATRRADLARMVRAFLTDLWRGGALDGATMDRAFTVTCDESNNPSEEQDAGRLVCDVRVKPPAPAEYVVVRIGIATGEKGVPGG